MKTFLFSLLLITHSLSYAQKLTPFVITGQIGQLNSPAKLFLVYGPQVLDSAVLYKGKFEMRGYIQWPHSAELILERQGYLRERGLTHLSSERMAVFLSNEPIKVTSFDSLENARVIGGPQLAAFKRLDAAQQGFTARFKSAHSPEEINKVAKEYTNIGLRFIRDNPTAWASLELIQQLRAQESSYTVLGPLYEAFSKNIKNSPPGRMYGEFVNGLKATAVSSKAPNFTLTTPEGKLLSLQDYHGQYVLIDFWASWCGPCREEFQTLLQVYDRYKGRNFIIIGVSLDEEKNRAKWLKAIADDHLTWLQASDLQGFHGNTAKSYGIQSIPQNFLVDPTGHIIAINLHGDDLQTKLAQFFD